MRKCHTINEAIGVAMTNIGGAISSQEAYDYIIAHALYEFHAQNPHQIVRSQIRRHCKGLEFPSSASKKLYEMGDDGRFRLLASPVVIKARRSTSREKALSSTLADLKRLHQAHTIALKGRLIEELKKLTPSGFEIFSMKLLDAYGFKDVK